MLATATRDSLSQDSLPVCLGRENSNRLVSLWDLVNRFDLPNTVAEINALAELECEFEIESENATNSQDGTQRLGERIKLLHAQCQRVGLTYCLEMSSII